MRKFNPKICVACGEEFTPTVGRQWLCGSKTKKIGCSYKNIQKYHADKQRRYKKDPAKINRSREYQREWKKKQRKNNTEYAEKQRSNKRAYYKTDKGKEERRAASKRNHKTKMACNRRREMRKKNVIGSHSDEQWENLKAKYGYKCSMCGIPEDHLQTLHGGTFFQKLTKDHIIPISKGGTDDISNIQPACVSCNASKHNNIEDEIVCVSGGFDCLHAGHVKMIQEAANYGKVIVILNSDEWLLRKKGYTFHPKWEDRAHIVYALRGVIGVSAVDDEDGTVCEALQRIRPKYFCNGGDRLPENTPELKLCCDLGIQVKFNVGGEKIQSSSELVRRAKQ